MEAGAHGPWQRQILDAALDCIIGMDAAGTVVEFNLAAERTFGYTRAQAIGANLGELIVPVAQREAHRLGLARYLATGHASVLGRRLELSAMHSDGSEFPVELAITRIEAAGPAIFMAFLRDISERVRSEQLRALRLASAQALVEAAEPLRAAELILAAVGQRLKWEFAALWLPDPRSPTLLRAAATWTAAPAFGGFEDATRRLRLRAGEGLPGRVVSQATPAWVLDFAHDAAFPRATEAARVGLRSAFACPLNAASPALGAFEFFTRQLREPDAELLETMGTIAGIFGHSWQRHASEERLRESEARFRALMEQAPFSMQIFAPDGRTERVNPAWSRLWGATLEDVAGYNVLQDRQLEEGGVLAPLRRAFAGDAVALPAIRYDPNLTLPDRSRNADAVRYVSAVAYPLKDDSGRVEHVVLVHEDATARHHAETALRESEEKFRLLADTIPQLAWMARPDGHIVWYNRRWYEYTGTVPEQMEGWGWQSVHDPQRLPDVLARWKASIETGETFDMVFPLRGADGTFRPFLTRVAPLRADDGRILSWFGTNTDVSEIKRMESALREADRRKDEFLATLAHELRNPLAPILNALAIMRLRGGDPAVAASTREIVERQVQQLVRLVDDLLDVSRIVSGKIELRTERTELAAVVERAVETAAPLIESRGHRLEVDVPEAFPVNGDAARLIQALGNVLVNAARYTPEQGRIALTVRRAAGEAVIEVVDNGLGIAPDVLPRIFEPFVQGHKSFVNAQGGLGIGLSLVKTIVGLHGGQVHARSDGPGTGARFTITLPLATDDRVTG